MIPLGTIHTRTANNDTRLVNYYELFTFLGEQWAITDLAFLDKFTVTHVITGTKIGVEGYDIKNIIANAKTTILTKGEKALKEQLAKHKPLNKVKEVIK